MVDLFLRNCTKLARPLVSAPCPWLMWKLIRAEEEEEEEELLDVVS